MIIDPRAKRRKTSQHVLIAIFLGLLFGGSLAAAQWFSTPWIRAKLAEQASAAELAERVLLQAESPHLIFRSSSEGIREGTDLHTALMAEQDDLLKSFQNRAENKSPENGGEITPWKVEIRYSLEAVSGPLSSLLRVETIDRPDKSERARYYSTLFNDADQTTLELSSLFKSSRGTIASLDKLLCQAIMMEKSERGYPLTINGPQDDCAIDPMVSFLDEAPFTFVPTKDAKFFSGIRFHFHAGRVGPQKQGDYIITIPQTMFRDYLVDHYRTRFTSVPPTS